MPSELDLCAEDLLPQKGGMCLLDRVIAADEEMLVATAMFTEDSLFIRDGQVGSWVGLECMAQAVAAWSGYQGRLKGSAPRIGFLLGSSRFDCLRPSLPVGAPLRIEVHKEIEMADGLGQFTGTIRDREAVIASAVITVFSPEEPMDVIRGVQNG